MLVLLDASKRTLTSSATARALAALNIDSALLIGLLLIAGTGLAVVYSASGGDFHAVQAQAVKLVIAMAVMAALAQVHPRSIRAVAPWLYCFGLVLLVAVAIVGDVAMGAQRWLDLGVVRFQPSELMKIGVPLACAWYLHNRALPPSLSDLIVVAAAIVIPAYLIKEQPDLGTAILVTASGAIVVLLAGLRIRYLAACAVLIAGVVVLGMLLDWSFLEDYQRRRVLTLLNPESDPLRSGYHILQSQIAVGSGGLFGKGYLNGSQAHLEFLPEGATDFIFAVIGEEWGLIGLVAVLALYAFVIGRCLYLAATAQDTFARLVAGTIGVNFGLYVLINASMVIGLAPVVGVPLPLISYGGTSMVTLVAGFGILMSVTARRKLMEG